MGSSVAENDDHGNLVDTAACANPTELGERDSCITVIGLPAGNYTLEVTTYNPGAVGAFTLTITGLGGNGDGTDAESDACAATNITADQETAGNFADDCQSRERSGRYARYYTFTLAQQSAVTIELTSDDVDTYLYLREGEVRSGDAEHENDDIESGGVNLNSRIIETLDAGIYTIEATTYNPNEAGTFTLTVSGLGSGQES